MPSGWNIYIDLDVVILKRFDEEVLWAIANDPNGESISVTADPILWWDNKFNSSFMIFKTGMQSYIYDKFVSDYKNIQTNWPGGDQVWMGLDVKPKTIYLEEQFPFLKRSLKYNIGEKILGMWKFPETVSSEIKMIDCSGRPKPDELERLKYIKECWHNI
jgi:hypothetical protein